MTRLLFIFLFLLALIGCKPIKVIREINQDAPSLYLWTNDTKSVVFIPMHHIGKSEFYSKVRDEIRSLKDQGFRVYYEGAGIEDGRDSLAKDTLQRKFRKMIGFMIDSGYAEMLHSKNLFRNRVDQPKWNFFGVDSTDERADITQNELVAAYEQKYGRIMLTENDKNLPLHTSNTVPKNEQLPKDKVFSIIIDHRDIELAKRIQLSSDQKIVVVFGKQHMRGVFENLKKMDNKWTSKEF